VFTISLFIKQIEFKSVYTSGYQTSCRTDFFTALTVGLAIERKKCRITGKCRQGKGRSTDQKDEKKKIQGRKWKSKVKNKLTSPTLLHKNDEGKKLLSYYRKNY
jgi:hypothetical protein